MSLGKCEIGNMEIDKIHHGDCIDIMSKMSDKSIHLTLTDIPYDECDKPSGGLRQIGKGQADQLNFDLNDFLNEVQRVTIGSIYIFCGIQQVSPIYKKFREDGMVTRHCVWQKSNPSPMNGQSTWLSALENCIFAKFGGAVFNESCKPNVWKYKSGTSKVHPTQKPVELMIRLIEASSKKEEVVFDPCVGSGTTAVACVKTERHFIGIEQDDKWYTFAQCRVKQAIQHDMYCLQMR